MKKINLIFKSILRFFMKNILSTIGLLMLVIFSSGIFTTLNNAIKNLDKSYNNSVKEGKLHDFVINDNFALGTANYIFFNENNDENNKIWTANIGPSIDNTTNKITWTLGYLRTYEDFLIWKRIKDNNPSISLENDIYFDSNRSLFEQEKVTINYKDNFDLEQRKETLIIQKKNNLQKLSENFLPNNFIKNIQDKNKGFYTISRRFQSINIPSNKQNIYYKVIESDPLYEVDKVVIYEGRNLTKNLSSNTFSGILEKYYSMSPEEKKKNYKIGVRILELMSEASWSDIKVEEGFRNLFKYIESKPDNEKERDLWSITINGNANLKTHLKYFKTIIDNKGFNDKKYELNFEINKGGIPVTSKVDDKNSYEIIVSPKFLQLNNKKVFPYDEWLLNKKKTQHEFDMWFKKISGKYKIIIDQMEFLIIGTGLSPDFNYPVVSLNRIVPNVKLEAITYTSNAGYEKVVDSFRANEKENMIVGRFYNNLTQQEKDIVINKIKELSRNVMSFASNIDTVYYKDDIKNVQTPATQRVIFIPNILFGIQTLSYFITSFVSILVFIIVALIIKRFILLNKSNFGIFQANGFSKWSIIVPMIYIISIIIFIGATIGFSFGLILQIPTASLFQTFWTIPITFTSFNGFTFGIFVIIQIILYALLTLLFCFILLRGDCVTNMKQEINYKSNAISLYFKKAFSKFSILTQFRASMGFILIWKLLFISIIGSLLSTSLIFGISSYDKFDKSLNQILASKNYNYAIDLYTPTYESGQYYAVPSNKTGATIKRGKYIVEENDSYGVTKNELLEKNSKYKYVFNSFWNESPYNSIKDSVLVNNLLRNSNLHTPGISDNTNSSTNILYLKNLSQTKLLLNNTFGLGALSANSWDIAEKLMPANQRNYANNSYSDLLSLALSFNDYKYFYSEGKQTTIRDGLLALSTDKNVTKNTNGAFFDPLDKKYRVLDKSKTTTAFGLKKELVNFVVALYSILDTINTNYFINYNKIIYKPEDEFYTYVDSLILKINGNNINDKTNIKIKGIDKNSKFIKLHDEKDNFIGHLIDNNLSNGNIPIIINAYVAKKYNLKLNDVLEIVVNNHVKRYSYPYWNENNPNTNIVKLQVVAVGNGATGLEIYMNRKNANSITGLSKLAADEKKIIYEKTGEILKETDYTTPFNGIIVKDKNLIQVTNSLNLYSPSGLYFGDDKIDSSKLLNYLMGNNKKDQEKYELLEEVTNITKIKLKGFPEKWDNSYNSNEHQKFVKIFIDELKLRHGSSMYASIIGSEIDSIEIINETFNVFNMIMGTLQIIALSIVIIICVIIMMIVVYMIILDSMKLSCILKILGLENIKNALSFILIYLPVIIFGTIISIPLTFFINIWYTNLIFSFAGIFINLNSLWWHYIVGALSISVLFIISFGISWLKIKRSELTKVIK